MISLWQMAIHERSKIKKLATVGLVNISAVFAYKSLCTCKSLYTCILEKRKMSKTPNVSGLLKNSTNYQKYLFMQHWCNIHILSYLWLTPNVNGLLKNSISNKKSTSMQTKQLHLLNYQWITQLLIRLFFLPF